MEKPLLSVREAAARLRLSEKRLRDLVARRQIGCVRPGGPRGHIFIPESEIDEHIRRHFRPARGTLV
jgi:excisionase family DNA binding protein